MHGTTAGTSLSRRHAALDRGRDLEAVLEAHRAALRGDDRRVPAGVVVPAGDRGVVVVGDELAVLEEKAVALDVRIAEVDVAAGDRHLLCTMRPTRTQATQR